MACKAMKNKYEISLRKYFAVLESFGVRHLVPSCCSTDPQIRERLKQIFLIIPTILNIHTLLVHLQF